MRLYHTILALSAIILALNAGFQTALLRQFSLVRETVEEFEERWLPTVRACGELTRLINEFRRYELRYALAESERDAASLARSMGRQADKIRLAEERLVGLLGSQAEQDAFAAYLGRKHEYLTVNREILISMMEGADKGALARLRASGASFAAMIQDIQAVEAIIHEKSEQAGREVDYRYLRVRLNMIIAGIAVICLGVAASVFAARRLSRPLWELARFMASQEQVPRKGDMLPLPRYVTREVSILYRAFRTLSARLARTMDRLEALSVTDQLTGAANRRRLMEEGAHILDICRRAGTPCAALMLDLDHFKAVNDTHGHAAGDAVLRAVAETLASIVRGSDLLARYGGEEFALVAPNSGLGDAALLAERLRAGVEARVIETPEARLSVTVSIGIAVADEAVRTLEQLLDKADQALYRAKQNGRNRVEGA